MPEPTMRGGLDIRMILFMLNPQRRLLCDCQPGSVLGSVLEVEIGGDAQKGGRNALGNEEPLPTMEPFEAVEILQRVRGMTEPRAFSLVAAYALALKKWVDSGSLAFRSGHPPP